MLESDVLPQCGSPFKFLVTETASRRKHSNHSADMIVTNPSRKTDTCLLFRTMKLTCESLFQPFVCSQLFCVSQTAVSSRNSFHTRCNGLQLALKRRNPERGGFDTEPLTWILDLQTWNNISPAGVFFRQKQTITTPPRSFASLRFLSPGSVFAAACNFCCLRRPRFGGDGAWSDGTGSCDDSWLVAP